MLELNEFGRRLGLDNLAWPESGPLNLELAGLGRLSLEEVPGGQLLISLALPWVSYEKDRLLRGLAMCAPEAGRPYPLACVLYRDRLIFMLRLPLAGLAASDVENAARFLISAARESAEA